MPVSTHRTGEVDHGPNASEGCARDGNFRRAGRWPPAIADVPDRGGLAGLRRHQRRVEVLAARSDQQGYSQGSSHRLASVRAAAARAESAARRRGPARLSAHAAEGGRPSLHEHVARDRRRARPGERRRRLVRSAAAAGRRQRVAGAGLLDRRQGRTDHRDLRPVPGRAERENGTALRRLRDGRRRRSLPGLPPCDPRRVPVGRPCHRRARRHRRRGHARRRGGHHQRDRARANGDASRRHPRLRRPHREAAVDVPHRAVARGVRERDLAERFVVLLRQRRRLVVDGGGRRARVRVSADRDADRRLLRRHAPRQQPLCRKPGGPGRQDRQTCLAFPGCPPRHLGLRLSRAARSRRRHGRWPPHQGDRADLEAGVRLRARSGDGTAGLANRRTAGRAR